MTNKTLEAAKAKVEMLEKVESDYNGIITAAK